MTAVYGQPITIGIEELASSWELYPNPAANKVTIKTEQEGVLYAFDINGKLLYDAPIGNTSEIDVAQWDNGTYVFVIVTLEGVARKKMIVVH